MIHIQSLIKIFRSEDVETRALNGVNLTVDQGEFVAIMGPSGCGKSTLLNLIGMLDAPTSGFYLFQNIDVSKYTERQRARMRKEKIGYIFQNYNLIDELTVYENIELPLIYLQVRQQDRKRRVKEILDRFEITHRRRSFPQQLSGGQQQQVAVARALITEPLLILADEPTGNLDSLHGEAIMERLFELNQAGATIVMVTHSQRDAEYGERIVNMFDGKIVNQRF